MSKKSQKVHRDIILIKILKIIIRLNNETRPHMKERIYNEHIRTSFRKVAENIIHTFKFYYFDVPSEDVKHEVVSFLYMNIHKFTEGKGSILLL